MITTPVVGSLAWGAPLNDQLETLAHDGMNPGDHGLIAWNYQPAQASAAGSATSGQLRVMRLPHLPEARTITNVCAFILAASVTGTAGQNFMGLYSDAGVLLGTTADATVAFSTSGPKILPLAAPVAAASGTYYVGILVNAATPATFAQASSQTALLPNFNLSAAQSAFANAAGAHTVLPASITMASLTPSAMATWAAVN